jgi:hypothetical protein
MPMRIADAERTGEFPPPPRQSSAFSRIKSSASLCLVAAALGGCMTVGDKVPPPTETAPPPVADPQPVAVAPPPPQVVSPVPTPRPKKPTREARAAPDTHTFRDRLVVIDPHRLIGLDPNGVQRLLGTPARVKNDDLSREWVYASPGCSFRVFFYPNLNSASFRVLKYGGSGENGELLDTSDVCVRRILTAKNNAAN